VATTVTADGASAGLIMAEGFDRELEALKDFLHRWTATAR
jgi:hypothetical protein